jgi:hypothetical protein
MDEKKIIKVLEEVKSKKGLSRKEIEEICGSETSFILGFLQKHDACFICENDRISRVKDENAALLVEELIERKKERKRDNIRWAVTTAISVIALILSIFSVLLPFL